MAAYTEQINSDVLSVQAEMEAINPEKDTGFKSIYRKVATAQLFPGEVKKWIRKLDTSFQRFNVSIRPSISSI